MKGLLSKHSQRLVAKLKIKDEELQGGHAILSAASEDCEEVYDEECNEEYNGEYEDHDEEEYHEKYKKVYQDDDSIGLLTEPVFFDPPFLLIPTEIRVEVC